ncbi:hypothetical protein B0H21DRAFT_707134 [Amylocystis lapponica]|nr:hypothetical protein B0H21DRAFT_707134 [Amylocystis lapponica]
MVRKLVDFGYHISASVTYRKLIKAEPRLQDTTWEKCQILGDELCLGECRHRQYCGRMGVRRQRNTSAGAADSSLLEDVGLTGDRVPVEHGGLAEDGRRKLASAYYDIMARLVFYRKMYEYDTAASGNPMWVTEVLHIWELLEQMVRRWRSMALMSLTGNTTGTSGQADGKRSDVYVQAALAGNLPDDFDNQDAAYDWGSSARSRTSH